MKILFDMASVIQTGLRKGTDGEAYKVVHEGREVVVNTAGHGYENAIDYVLWVLDNYKVRPSDAILVFEGRDSKKRRVQIFGKYKAGRGKSAPEYYDEYNKCKSMVREALCSVGAIAVTQDLCEGDDTLAYLADGMEEEVIVVSNDVDLSVLNGANRKGFMVTTLAGSEERKMPENVFEKQHVTLYKTLVGDPNDSIPGVKMFGKVAWEELIAKYGGDGLDELCEIIKNNDSDELVMFAKQNGCKLLTKIVDSWDMVQNMWKVVSLHPEWVDTRYYPLVWEPGIVRGKGSDTRLHRFAQVNILVTADNYPEALARLKGAVEKFPDLPAALDVETWSPEEADHWFEDQGKSDGVDPISSRLAGFSITFGPGGRYTYYVSVDHYQTNNVSMKQAREMIEVIMPVVKPIHNTYFELVVLYNDHAKDEDGSLWRDHWKKFGQNGFMANIEDTLLMASYVDENAMSRGLKSLSKNILGYQQTEFNETRTFKLSEPMLVKFEDQGGAELTPVGYFDSDESRPYPGGKTVTKRVKSFLYENGVKQYTDKGVPRQVSEVVKVQAQSRDGLVTTRVRNKETGIMENQPKMVSVPLMEREVVYKMNELPATEVFAYGCDDTICTLAYYNFAKLHMIFDEHYHVYRKVEISAAYLHARAFYDGFPIDMGELRRQSRRDSDTKEGSERILHNYLAKHGWAGTVQPKYDSSIDSAQIKEAYKIVFGIDDNDEDSEDGETVKDAILSSRTRTPSKFVDLIGAEDREGAEIFAGHLKRLLEGDEDSFNKYVGSYFTGKPRFVYGPKDKSKLMYDIMKLEVVVRNPVTPAMRQQGIREGTASTDTLAINYGIMELEQKGDTEALEVLHALQKITTVNTREGLFYKPYPGFIHWSTGKVHSHHRQCHANTRRASSAEPNMQQQPAHEKVKGMPSDFRRVVVPHKRRAVILCLDFNAQELRAIADDSQDPKMLACYVGDNLKDMHSITGAGIAMSKVPEIMAKAIEELTVEYETFDDKVYYAFKSLEAKVQAVYDDYRGLGKKTNFTTEYGAMADKVAATLMVSKEDAQKFIDIREETFKVAAEWKAKKLVEVAKQQGFIRTRLGAKRHLAEMLDSDERGVASKAERQAVNFRIQGSCAEQTKLAEGRMWDEGLFSGVNGWDAVYVGPVHDEVVASVDLDNLEEFIPAIHKAMVASYADMKVPVVSSISFGPNFYDQINVGEEPTAENIRKAVAKLKERFPEYA